MTITSTNRTLRFIDQYPDGVDATVRAGLPGAPQAREVLDRLSHFDLPDWEFSEFVDPSLGNEHWTLSNWLLAQAEKGPVTTDDLLAASRRIVVDWTAYGLAQAVAKSAMESAKSRLDGMATDEQIASGYARAFALLQNDLDALEPLDQILEPDTAVDHDRLEDHRYVQKLFAAYADLRRRHMILVAGLDQTLRHPEALIVRDVPSVFPEWAAWSAHGYLISRRTPRGTVAVIATPWPNLVNAQRGRTARRDWNDVRDDCADSAFLLWARAAKVPLWMPTRAEYEAEADRLREVRRAAIRVIRPSSQDLIDPSTPEAVRLASRDRSR